MKQVVTDAVMQEQQHLDSDMVARRRSSGGQQQHQKHRNSNSGQTMTSSRYLMVSIEEVLVVLSGDISSAPLSSERWQC